MNSILFTFCNAGFKTTLRLFGDQVVEGRENIPEHGPLIFIANHLSNLDPPIVAALTGRKPGFLAKKELFKLPPVAWFLNTYGAHPLNRGLNDLGALRWGVRRLAEPDGALILFPEGTRDKTGGGMRQGLSGVTHVALMSGAPIIPIGITGSEPLQNMAKVLVPRARLRIKIGKPVQLVLDGKRRPSKDDVQSMTTEIMLRVARLLPESYRGYYRDQMDVPFVYTKELDAASPDAVTAPAT